MTNINTIETPEDMENAFLTHSIVDSVTSDIVYDKDDRAIIIYNIKLVFWVRLKCIFNARERNKIYLKLLNQGSHTDDIHTIIKLVL